MPDTKTKPRGPGGPFQCPACGLVHFGACREPEPARNVTSTPDTSRSEPRFRLYSLCPCAVCQNTGKDAVGDRCEQCRGEGKQRVRVAESDTMEGLGVALVTCAREGAWPDGCQFGLLDQEGDTGLKWLVRPWQASPTARNAADAARVLAGKRWK